MIDNDDLDAIRLQNKPGSKPRDLQPMSISELEDYIAALESEIARADAMITKKVSHKSGIDALFGSKSDD